ncbi:hypothetical protein C2W62_18965 [Candidatus Entotheonella serta]|nr:hypothetical protein C2W62_18965 [Candidatus Entotheonella serta]
MLAVIARLEDLANDGEEPEANRERARLLRQNFIFRQTTSTPGKRLLRYILCELERQFSGHDVAWHVTSATVEHILPEHLSEDWRELFSEDMHQRYVDRLGNYALLERGKNKEAGQQLFYGKKAVFETSQYGLTRQLLEVEEWGPKRHSGTPTSPREDGDSSVASTVLTAASPNDLSLLQKLLHPLHHGLFVVEIIQNYRSLKRIAAKVGLVQHLSGRKGTATGIPSQAKEPDALVCRGRIGIQIGVYVVCQGTLHVRFGW